MYHPGTFSKLQALYGIGTPPFVKRGSTDDPAKVLLSDGKEYIDTVMGLGAYVRGYDPGISRFVGSVIQLTRGAVFGLPHTLLKEAVTLALGALDLRDWVAHPVRTGSDGCMGAVKVARAARPGKVAVLKECYHGQHVQWKDPARGSLLDRAHIIEVDQQEGSFPRAGELSCIILEFPVSGLREVCVGWIKTCVQQGVILIADEVVTALRWKGNLALRFLDPSIVVAGKALANGFGFYAIFLKPELASLLRPPSPVFVSTTYAGDVVALAGAVANLVDAENLGGYLVSLGYSLWSLLDLEFFTGKRIKLVGQPARFAFDGDPEAIAVFRQECLRRGMLVNRPFAITTAHAPHLAKMAEIMNEALDCVRRGVELEGELPISLFSER